MAKGREQSHRDAIIQQFSQQAVPFTQVPGHYDALQLLVEMSGVGKLDEVLDVACGPGLVACEFARYAKHVTGVDITPAMIEQARQRQDEQRLENLSWDIGTAVPLAYPDRSFSLIITRYSFHHLLKPQEALSEMIRVSRPGGAVMVADVAMPPAKSAAYDHLELIRDPSHTHALTEEEFEALFQRSGLVDCRRSAYGVDIELETQIRASFPKPGDDRVIRELVSADVGVDRLGVNAREEAGKIVYTVPIAVYVGRKR
ncbi:methyltransferase domain-containing protein [Geomonas subterranea]|uniref:Methyltransferase domain-containing protein n=1 Tax=Geomonas subterranea TaxID=2847989 RepID=A0ABX8LNA0_9BACT|nr:methyltransferase domain-containing protein [Geomonas subterranea]QXE91005.1 methyltransferase domain-containing protein [Geomonas subterranea]QXM10910.1 methyltransferase domain-containing protein [Geomonas subterranea]